MLLAKIVGTVVSTKKEASLEGLRLMVCKPVSVEGAESASYVIAADAVGAGVGEMVLYASGSSARQTVQTNNRPCDAVIMAIVDNWEVGGEFKYQKSEDV